MFVTTVTFLMFVKNFKSSFQTMATDSLQRVAGADINVLNKPPWQKQGGKPLPNIELTKFLEEYRDKHGVIKDWFY